MGEEGSEYFFLFVWARGRGTDASIGFVGADEKWVSFTFGVLSMLASNAFIAVLSSPEERTSQFGVLQGIAMRELSRFVSVSSIRRSLSPRFFFSNQWELGWDTVVSTWSCPQVSPAFEIASQGLTFPPSLAGSFFSFFSSGWSRLGSLWNPITFQSHPRSPRLLHPLRVYLPPLHRSSNSSQTRRRRSRKEGGSVRLPLAS